jgi:hypothetical protein
MNWAFAKCNWMFAVCTLQQFITFFDYTVCAHTWIALLSHGLLYFLWVHLCITWSLVFPSLLFIWLHRFTLCSFENLQISLLENLALLLCIVCEFGIGIVRMLIVWCQHCAQFTILFECTMYKYTWILTNVFCLNASKGANTLHYV